ncbi:MAG: AmmeMemoRadiSam system protein B [Kiritimatiellae bacterium]|nr:AmmeMemoRadiSam system protein B [Kiritimatiellia bacterium]
MALVSTIAGTWYPADVHEIHACVESWESGSRSWDEEKPNVLLLPHAGWAYSGETAWRAVRLVRGAGFRRVVLLAPSHAAWIENRLVVPESDAVSTPLGEIKIDKEWIDRLALIAPVSRKDRVLAAEHAVQIEYPFFQLALGDGFSIVPIVVGTFGTDQMAMCVRGLSRLMDAETLLVISTDFTHYGDDFSYTPYGTTGGEEVRAKVAAIDDEAFSLISKGDADAFSALMQRTGATICGRVAIELALRASQWKTPFTRLAYTTSSDKSRDFSRFVCYAAGAGRAEWQGEAQAVLNAEDRAFLLRVARETIENAVCGGGTRRFLQPTESKRIPPSALQKMGAFVTLKDRRSDALRGCIGEILPMRPLVEVVARRAIDAALHDPRFLPVTGNELASLRIEISVLTPPAPVTSWRDIVLGRDGMTFEKKGRFAVFLPQVAPEQRWDLPTTLSHLARKAGLPADAWRDGAKFSTFRAEVFHE